MNVSTQRVSVIGVRVRVCVCVCRWGVLVVVGVDGKCASVAQWLEHWSSKPGVESSILSGGSCLLMSPRVRLVTRESLQ